MINLNFKTSDFTTLAFLLNDITKKKSHKHSYILDELRKSHQRATDDFTRHNNGFIDSRIKFYTPDEKKMYTDALNFYKSKFNKEYSEHNEISKFNADYIENDFNKNKEFVESYLNFIFGKETNFSNTLTIQPFNGGYNCTTEIIWGHPHIFNPPNDSYKNYNSVFIAHELMHDKISNCNRKGNSTKVKNQILFYNNEHSLIELATDNELRLQLNGYGTYFEKGFQGHNEDWECSQMNYPYWIGMLNKNKENPEDEMNKAFKRDGFEYDTKEILKKLDIYGVDNIYKLSNFTYLMNKERELIDYAKIGFEHVKYGFRKAKNLFIKPSLKEEKPVFQSQTHFKSDISDDLTTPIRETDLTTKIEFSTVSGEIKTEEIKTEITL